MKTYSIKLTFTDPYIGARNGGNRALIEGLSLKQAKGQMLLYYNENSDKYACTWAEAKRQTRNGVALCASGTNSIQRLDYDSRVYEIVEDRA